MARYVVGTTWGFVTDQYDDSLVVFTDLDVALNESNEQNKLCMMPDPNGPGLIHVDEWKVYELVEVKRKEEP